MCFFDYELFEILCLVELKLFYYVKKNFLLVFFINRVVYICCNWFIYDVSLG